MRFCALLAFACCVIFQQPLSPRSAQAQAPKPIEVEGDVQGELVSDLYNRNKHWPAGQSEQIAYGEGLLREGQAMLVAHPESSPATVNGDLLIRRVLLPVAERLYNLDRTVVRRDVLAGIALQIAQSPVYDAHLIHTDKIHAASLVASLAIFNDDGDLQVDATEAEDLIQGIIDAFPAMPGETGDEPDLTYPAAAHGAALRLAGKAHLPVLVETYLEAIENEPVYMRAPHVVAAMVELGRGPIFRIETETLDGDPFTMPTDTQGKVVVVDFWATWCGPCVASMPHIKELHDAYTEQDVIFVGVSADEIESSTQLEDLQEFVTSNGYNWTHVNDGGWPVFATDYGVSRLPTVMVIGKDGRIFHTNARFNLEEVIDQALAQED